MKQEFFELLERLGDVTAYLDSLRRQVTPSVLAIHSCVDELRSIKNALQKFAPKE